MTSYLKYMLSLFCIFCSGSSFAQIERGNYCACKMAASYQHTGTLLRHKVYSEVQNKQDSIITIIYNPTKDTLYLFSSYLQPQFYYSAHLHRIDVTKHIYKISFLPIVPHLFVRYADNITGDPIMGQNQVVYDFIKMPPGSKYAFSISKSILLSRKNQPQNVSADYNVRLLNKYSKSIPTTLKRIDLKKSGYKTEFEFAIYSSVKMLCDQTSFYMKEADFDRQSKNFVVLTVPFHIR